MPPAGYAYDPLGDILPQPMAALRQTCVSPKRNGISSSGLLIKFLQVY
ncbi:hypothetical protein [Phormidium nigroviride]